MAEDDGVGRDVELLGGGVEELLGFLELEAREEFGGCEEVGGGLVAAGGAAGVGAVAGAVAATTRGVAVERAGGGGARAVAWVICPAGEGLRASGGSGAARLARADDEGVRPVGSALAEGVLVERAEFALERENLSHCRVPRFPRAATPPAA